MTEAAPTWLDAVIADTVKAYHDEWLTFGADVRDNGTLPDLLNGALDSMPSRELVEVLDTYGHRDLSEPCVDLSVGWPRILRALAYNALEKAVVAAFPPETPL